MFFFSVVTDYITVCLFVKVSGVSLPVLHLS
jgi:hypothetical protein